jgi:ribosomal protein S27AE
MTENNKEYLVELLRLAQSGDRIAENNLIKYIRDNEMQKRISKYLHKNRQVEDEDLKQEFLIGVALNISKADLEIGNPIEYIISQGIYRVRSYLRKHIIQNTTQICGDCGYESRLNRVGNQYVCKKCGSTNITTREISDHDETALENKCIDEDEIEKLIESLGADDIIMKFRETLDSNTKMYSLFVLLYDEDINSDNPEIDNYIKEIANRWGTSQTLVIQVKEKLKIKLLKFCESEKIDIKHNKFTYRES